MLPRRARGSARRQEARSGGDRASRVQAADRRSTPDRSCSPTRSADARRSRPAQARGRMPKPHKKGTWEAAVETAVGVALEPEVGRGDVIRVDRRVEAAHAPGDQRAAALRHGLAPRDGDAARRSMRAARDGGVACEATGNAAAHGINVVHYRLAEARQLQAAGKHAECQRAALEAIAVARGLPRWRQYVHAQRRPVEGVPALSDAVRRHPRRGHAVHHRDRARRRGRGGPCRVRRPGDARDRPRRRSSRFTPAGEVPVSWTGRA